MIDEYVEYIEPYWKFYHDRVWLFISSVGWYFVGISVVLIYAWPSIQKLYRNWKKTKDEQEYDMKYHKNVDLSSKLLIATQLAREKQQEKYLRERELALEKEKERVEKKRQEVLRLEEQRSSGTRLGNSSEGAAGPSKSTLKGEYNPLMGESSKRYIPPKRSCCKKGGCG
ncbi:uncharacterized protein LOC131665314 [Phymastichus coffea]|uniref:uncharacterized protein LOC131665314 n=1 Tax=Phymastichus coffea TaxID=108790 RepID=UPI00273BC0FE|nr:uncharacterized protein LOC131665314 [Phymastichus coffea]